MKINRIELYNIGSYEGLNIFDVEAQNEKGNIVVVGGKNGAGKTTLFTAIKLCLYGFKNAGYQAMNSFYKKEIKKLVNDKAKAENNANAYALLDLDIMNGQEWDKYVLKREWALDGQIFETFTVSKNGTELDEEEKVDFDNYLMNLLPPELFELYFFDGEQIADYFLEDSNNERIKNAFLTICGYDTFDIIYKNFKRVSKQESSDGDPMRVYFDAEDTLRDVEVQIRKYEKEIQTTCEEIETEDTKLRSLEETYKSAGGVSAEVWNQKMLDLKNEERIREEKNAWVKNAVNDEIPFIILSKELTNLLIRMNKEQESNRSAVVRESLLLLIPEVLQSVMQKHPEINKDIQGEIIAGLSEKTDCNTEDEILKLSKNEFERLSVSINQLLGINKQKIIEARKEIKDSLLRSQLIREEIEKSNVEGFDSYLTEKENAINRKHELINDREALLKLHVASLEELEKAKQMYSKASKDLEKHFKTESVTALTGKAIRFLESLQKKLYDAEIVKVKRLFMDKMTQLMRKEQFIDRIEIDNDFNVHVFKKVNLEVRGIQDKLRMGGCDAYRFEYGEIHCSDLLVKTECNSLDALLQLDPNTISTVDVLMEFDKTTMSKGEKQVFIMALYWSIMQLCNKDIPFIIDTPFARIDTEHREHITEHFFKELHGQIFIFSTDEEITSRHMEVIGDKLGGKFLIENIDNTKTSITAGKYFGE